MMPLKQNFIYTFSNELTPVLLDFYDCPLKLGTIWVLLLEQESYFSYMKKMIKKILQTTETPRHLAQLSIWRGGLGILDIDTQLNFLKIKWIERLLNSIAALWKHIRLFWLKLILNSNQGLTLFRQKQVLRSTSHKSLQKRNNEDNVLLHLNNNN